MGKRYYLATTGISEIWDLNNGVLILGPWCLTDKRNLELLKVNEYRFVNSPWKPVIKIKEAADYCHNIYEDLLPKISEIMNFMHNVSHPVKYWRILLGPWLLHFIEIFYDRYERLLSVAKQYPNFYTNSIPLENCDISTLDTLDFVENQINSDSYNLNVFSLILNKFFPENTEITKVDLASDFERKNPASINWRKKILNNLLRLGGSSFGSPIMLFNMYHLTIFDLLKLKIKAWNIGYFNSRYKNESKLITTCSTKLRSTIKIEGPADDFQSFLNEIIPRSIPTCYIENYRFYKHQFYDRVKNIKAIGSSTGWYFDEKFKFFSAEATLVGAKTLEFQHGGGYGFLYSMPVESLAKEKDIFYSWGWNTYDERVVPLPSPHLSRLKNKYSKKIDNLLFVGTGMPRYHFRFHSLVFPEDMAKYFDNKNIFLQNLNQHIKENSLYRPYLHDYGWHEVELMKKIQPNIKIICRGKLTDWIKKVNMVVIDHPHTAFLEALVINAPSVFYWDSESNLMRPEAEEYFNLLRRAGILFNKPSDAAGKANEVFLNAEKWWMTSEVQKARIKFCERYAYTRSDWANIWVKEFGKFN